MTKKNTRVYLDYAAGTPVDPEVEAVMHEYRENNFSHPSSLHENGRTAKRAREDARFAIASMIGARSGECYFTGGGTDGMTRAIYGTINAFRERGIEERSMHIVMSIIEHASVRGCVEALSRRGIATSIIGVTAEGIIDVEQLKNALRPETVLVITMLVNNEIGTIQPVREIHALIEKAYEGQRPVHLCDASQAPMALSINTQSIGADIVVLDAHKCYGPFATGLLYVKTGTPYVGLCGAPGKTGDEGTPDIAALLGMQKALEIANDRRNEDVKRWKELKPYLVNNLQERFPEVRIHGNLHESVPTILNISFPNIEGEFLVSQLDAEGIAVSAKSACLSGGGEGSYVVQAIDPERANNSIRISFGRETTQDDIDVLISVLSDIVSRTK
jgi:cysteine desulfurase